MFYHGTGRIPEDYQDIYLCDLLQMPYTTLCEQPEWFIQRMKIWMEQKHKAEQTRYKLQQQRASPKR